MTLWCVIILTQGHFDEVKVNGKKSVKFVYFLEKTKNVFTSLKDYLRPEGVMTSTQGNLAEVKVTGRKSAKYVSGPYPF